MRKNKNICVSAGAGSGKTRRLVQRFIDAVTIEKIAAERILAITFTDRAANQMKSRVVSEFSKRGLWPERRALENGHMGTLHSFCARFLRENPVECGIDPFFQILSEGESEVLKKRQLDRLFESSVEKSLWLSLLIEHGEGSVRQAIELFYETSRAAGDWEVFLSGGNWGDSKEDAHRKLLTLLKKFIAGLDRDKLTESENGLRMAAFEILQRLESGEKGWANFRYLDENLKRLHELVPRRKEAVKIVKAAAALWKGIELIELGAAQRQAFIEMACAFKESYEAEKRKIASYDFDDLVSRVYHFFQQEDPQKNDLKDRIRRHFELVLVDECQDLSPLQAKLIRSLAREDNLFLVGDAQQAIYGFRFADPQVFKTLSAGLPQRLTKHEELFENYRTEPALLRLINDISFQVMEGSFTPLEPKKPLRSEDPVLMEVIAIEKEASMDLEEARMAEARALAQHIRGLVDAGRFNYGDIAVLFKTFSSSSLYEKAFAEAGIPYFLLRSRGFYERPEIRDLIHGLRLAENPNSDISLAAVLRSPLVSLSEDALFWLAHAVKKEDENIPLAHALDQNPPQLGEADRKKLGHFTALLDWLRRNKNKKPLGSLLETILRETDYEAKILALEDGRQMIANVRKFSEIIEGLEKRGLVGIEEVASFLEGMAKEREESSAKLEGGEGDVVVFSTVHAAKGLEYPCVVVADMGSQPKRNHQGHFAFSISHGIGLKVMDSETGKIHEDALYTAIRSDVKEKQLAEDRRLFYVAMTRAKERLIFSGVSTKDSWMGRLLKIIDAKSRPGIYRLEPELQKARRKILALSENELIRKHLKEAKPFSVKEAEDAGLGWDEAAFEEIRSRFTPPSKIYDALEDATVTDLVSLKSKSPGEFLEEKEAETLNLEEDVLPRNEYGTIYHKVMEFLVAQKPSRLLMKTLLPASARRLSAPEKKELEESVRRFWTGPWGELIKKSRCCYTELPFLYKTKHGTLKGQIDLVVQARDGSWIVLDYKTNRLRLEEISGVGEDYRLQLLLYAFVFSKLYGIAPKKGVLYFSHVHEALGFNYRPEDFVDIGARLDDLFEEAIVSKSS